MSPVQKTSNRIPQKPDFYRCILSAVPSAVRYPTMPRSPLHQLTRREIVNAKSAITPYTLSGGGRFAVLIKPSENPAT
jgi:hypothetical protein